MKKRIITLLASLALVFGIGCVSHETPVEATIVQDELQKQSSVTLVRFLLYQDTQTGKILGRQHQTITVSSLDSHATFKPFAPISPQLPNYKIDKIVNNVPLSWEQADNINHQAPTVYVYMSKVKIVNNYGGSKHVQNSRRNNSNRTSVGNNRQSDKRRKVRHSHNSDDEDHEEGVQSEEKHENNGNKLFWLVVLFGSLLAIFLICAGIRLITKNKKKD